MSQFPSFAVGLLIAALSLPALARPAAAIEPSRDIYGEVRLIDEVIPGAEEPRHMMSESEPGVSTIETILGRPTRVIPNTGETARYVAWRLGQGRGLKANGTYLLQIEYPEDQPRTMFIHNRGSETSRGLHTGDTVGDVLLGRYVNSNNESLNYPLSGRHEAFQMLFHLQDQFVELKMPREQKFPRSLKPADGIPVIVSQWKASNAPLSHGAAVSRIALYEVTQPEALKLPINYPPDGLPRRHLFWREEMSDGVVDKNDPGWNNDVDWFESKAKLMQFLGMNTYSIDLLEFGHNQGWDSAPGGRDWVNEHHNPKRWENVLRMLKAGGYDFTVLPYYEYAGSVGKNSPGTRKFARPLSDKIQAYTHVTWSEKAYADVTEDIILEDAKKVLDLTITRWKDIMPFTGAWLRTRPSHIPVSFSDNALAKFSKERRGGEPVTREQLAERGALYREYLDWWFEKRKAFIMALRDHLREKVDPNAIILFTADASEPGVSLPGGGTKVVTDDVDKWKAVAAEKNLKIEPVALDPSLAMQHLEAQLSPRPTWGDWEWDHSVPGSDPQRYQDTEGVLQTYSFNRVYTVCSPQALEAFRMPSGLAMMRHYTLNENEMDEAVGYFVIDVDLTGPLMMHAEVLAVANGDPWYIGYFAGHRFNRGFPQYARRFNQAYLSLPALPSEVVSDAASDQQVVVRAIRTEQHGTWLAICNTDVRPKENVTIRLPEGIQVTDAATGAPLEAANGQLQLSLDAAELRTVHVK